MRQRERERRDAGRGWQNNISADSAAASGAALTFSARLEEEDRVKVSKTEEERNTYPRVTKRDGQYRGKYRKRDAQRLKEEEQVAALDEVCKAQTFVLKDTHTQRVCRKPNTGISLSR